jgi:hypothetical protein
MVPLARPRAIALRHDLETKSPDTGALAALGARR